jgi:hypothetical protein
MARGKPRSRNRRSVMAALYEAHRDETMDDDSARRRRPMSASRSLNSRMTTVKLITITANGVGAHNGVSRSNASNVVLDCTTRLPKNPLLTRPGAPAPHNRAIRRTFFHCPRRTVRPTESTSAIETEQPMATLVTTLARQGRSTTPYSRRTTCSPSKPTVCPTTRVLAYLKRTAT